MTPPPRYVSLHPARRGCSSVCGFGADGEVQNECARAALYEKDALYVCVCAYSIFS